MIEIENKDCKIFTDNIEPEALEQIYGVLKLPENEGLKVRIMPDVHGGKGICIGFTSTVGDYINPDYIGVDIGCSVSLALVDKPIQDLELFEHRLKGAVPMGPDIHTSRQFQVKEFLAFLRTELQRAYQATGGLIFLPDFNSESDLERWCREVGIDLATFYKSIGTLGGGNHYIEYDEGTDEHGKPVYGISVHTGSRNLGLKVNKYWTKEAEGTKVSKEVQKEIAKKVREYPGIEKKDIKRKIDLALDLWKRQNLHPGFLSGENLRGYLTDVCIASAYAKWNHKIILDKALEIYTKITATEYYSCPGKEIQRITTQHNYIDFTSPVPIIRKGSVSAKEGEIFLLPFNMRDGIAVCKGKGNADWNYSSPHGSGRKMSRNAAKSKINLKDYEKSMTGIYSTTVCRETIDESPMAYKDTSEILSLIDPTAEVLYTLKPKMNIKSTK